MNEQKPQSRRLLLAALSSLIGHAISDAHHVPSPNEDAKTADKDCLDLKRKPKQLA